MSHNNETCDAEARYRRLFENLPDAIITLGTGGEILDANPTSKIFFNIEEPAGSPALLRELLAPRCGDVQRLDTFLKKIHAGSKGKLKNLPLTTGRGETYFFDIDALIYRAPDSSIKEITLIFRDVTEVYHYTNEREAIIDKLSRANRELKDFTHTVSHDLRSPLVTIQGFLNLILSDIESGDYTELNEHIERVIRTSRKMEALLDDLLKRSRPFLDRE